MENPIDRAMNEEDTIFIKMVSDRLSYQLKEDEVIDNTFIEIKLPRYLYKPALLKNDPTLIQYYLKTMYHLTRNLHYVRTPHISYFDCLVVTMCGIEFNYHPDNDF